jgi:hypothetical protein
VLLCFSSAYKECGGTTIFVRKQRNSRDGSDYHQLVESRRVDGQPRQKVVMHLRGNPTLDEALKS